jgi:hypothetical protein
MDPIVRVSRDGQVFRSALGDALPQQIAPGIIRVAVAPVLGFSIQRGGSTICAGILGRGQPVQRVIGKALVAAAVFVVVIPKTFPLSVPLPAVPFPTWKS